MVVIKIQLGDVFQIDWSDGVTIIYKAYKVADHKLLCTKCSLDTRIARHAVFIVDKVRKKGSKVSVDILMSYDIRFRKLPKLKALLYEPILDEEAKRWGLL
mgnify:CR=1 FL=1